MTKSNFVLKLMCFNEMLIEANARLEKMLPDIYKLVSLRPYEEDLNTIEVDEADIINACRKTDCQQNKGIFTIVDIPISRIEDEVMVRNASTIQVPLFICDTNDTVEFINKTNEYILNEMCRVMRLKRTHMEFDIESLEENIDKITHVLDYQESDNLLKNILIRPIKKILN